MKFVISVKNIMINAIEHLITNNEHYITLYITHHTKRTNTKIGGRAFSAAAPEIWNASHDIKLFESLDKFKIYLKTHSFRIAFK